MLEVLVRKTETIKRELGSLSKVIDDDIERRLGQGIRHRDAERLAREIEAADLEAEKKRITEEELEAARERQENLEAQIERCRNLLEASRAATGFEAGAVPRGPLLLAGAPRRRAARRDHRRARRGRLYMFPPLDRRAATDPSWAATLDTLRAPRKHNQKLADWRREAPIRPVVFEDAGVLTEDVVHLHLEHRVVQRLLARFRAQGFVHHDLSRACLAQTRDAIPRVVLLGRLSLYGRGAARLHEELVPVTARWVEPSQRKGPLEPYAREAETRTLDLLERSLAGQWPPGARGGDPAQAPRRGRARHRRAAAAARAARRGVGGAGGRRLRERGEREARDLRETLERQRERVREELAKVEGNRIEQLTLGFDEEEKRQLEADVRSWRSRLAQFDRDLGVEPDRIREFYEVKARRIEPVGLVYLWPESN